MGVWLLGRVAESAALPVLGAVLAAYAAYSLLSPRVPSLTRAVWGLPFGLVAGLLGGAFNSAGPPVVVYGTLRRWPPEEFKGNLQAFFLINTTLVVISHGLAGSLTTAVWQRFALIVPAALVGLFAGQRVDRALDPRRFRQVVLWLLLVMGLRLLLLL